MTIWGLSCVSGQFDAACKLLNTIIAQQTFLQGLQPGKDLLSMQRKQLLT